MNLGLERNDNTRKELLNPIVQNGKREHFKQNRFASEVEAMTGAFEQHSFEAGKFLFSIIALMGQLFDLKSNELCANKIPNET